MSGRPTLHGEARSGTKPPRTCGDLPAHPRVLEKLGLRRTVWSWTRQVRPQQLSRAHLPVSVAGYRLIALLPSRDQASEAGLKESVHCDTRFSALLPGA